MRLLAYIIFLFLSLGSAHLSAETLVLIPSNAPTSETRAFRTIASGVRNKRSDTRIVSVEPLQLRSRFNINPRTSRVVVLGREMISAYAELGIDVPWIAGGFVGDIDDDVAIDALSLNTSPALVYQEIAKLNKNINTIYTLQQDGTNTQLMLAARQDARLYGIDLVVVNATSMRSTARGWFNIFKNIDPRNSAVWIHDDTYLESSGSFKYINETSWKNSVLHLSTVPAHATRGVALGFVPQLEEYGEALIEKLDRQTLERNNKTISFLPRKAAQRIVNERTLDHQGRGLPKDINRLHLDDVVIR